MGKAALITGITGQDGSYLAEYLLSIGYDVWGMIRRQSSSEPIDRIERLTGGKANLRYGDMTDSASINRILSESKPDEIYNLAAQSHVGISFKTPEYTSKVNGTGVLNILQSAQEICPDTKVYQASTSELFGSTLPPQNELTMMHPRSPYGVAKLHGYWSVINYRESYGMFASNGILFNHESPRRGENFVTRKITRAVARIYLGKQSCLSLGNLDAKRDWGFAKDYVEGMHAILQHSEPDDFVLATGQVTTVRDFVERAFAAVGYEIESNGLPGTEEKYFFKGTSTCVVQVDPLFYRPAEVEYLLGDPSKAKELLGWEAKTSLPELVAMMVDADLEIERR